MKGGYHWKYLVISILCALFSLTLRPSFPHFYRLLNLKSQMWRQKCTEVSNHDCPANLFQWRLQPSLPHVVIGLAGHNQLSLKSFELFLSHDMLPGIDGKVAIVQYTQGTKLFCIVRRCYLKFLYHTILPLSVIKMQVRRPLKPGFLIYFQTASMDV